MSWRFQLQNRRVERAWQLLARLIQWVIDARAVGTQIAESVSAEIQMRQLSIGNCVPHSPRHRLRATGRAAQRTQALLQIVYPDRLGLAVGTPMDYRSPD